MRSGTVSPLASSSQLDTSFVLSSARPVTNMMLRGDRASSKSSDSSSSSLATVASSEDKKVKKVDAQTMMRRLGEGARDRVLSLTRRHRPQITATISTVPSVESVVETQAVDQTKPENMAAFLRQMGPQVMQAAIDALHVEFEKTPPKSGVAGTVISVVLEAVSDELINKTPLNEADRKNLLLEVASQFTKEAAFFETAQGKFPSKELVASWGLRGQILHTTDNQFYQIFDRLDNQNRRDLDDLSFRVAEDGTLYKVEQGDSMLRHIRMARKMAGSSNTDSIPGDYVTVKIVSFAGGPEDALGLALRAFIAKENSRFDRFKKYDNLDMERVITSHAQIDDEIYQVRDLYRDGSLRTITDELRRYYVIERGDKATFDMCVHALLVKQIRLMQEFANPVSSKDAGTRKHKKAPYAFGDMKPDNLYFTRTGVMRISDAKGVVKGNAEYAAPSLESESNGMDYYHRIPTPPRGANAINCFSSEYADPRRIYKIDGESDHLNYMHGQLFSLGAMMHLLFTGELKTEYKLNKPDQQEWMGEHLMYAQVKKDTDHPMMETVHNLMHVAPQMRPSLEKVMTVEWMAKAPCSDETLLGLIASAMANKRKRMQAADVAAKRHAEEKLAQAGNAATQAK